MDVSEVQQWKAALSIAWNNPRLIVPFCLLVIGLALWIGRRTGSAGKASLTKETEALKQQHQIASRRLALASDRQRRISEKLREAEIELANLKFRISEVAATIPEDAGELLTTSVDLVATNIQAVVSANNELRQALTADER